MAKRETGRNRGPEHGKAKTEASDLGQPYPRKQWDAHLQASRCRKARGPLTPAHAARRARAATPSACRRRPLAAEAPVPTRSSRDKVSLEASRAAVRVRLTFLSRKPLTSLINIQKLPFNLHPIFLYHFPLTRPF